MRWHSYRRRAHRAWNGVSSRIMRRCSSFVRAHDDHERPIGQVQAHAIRVMSDVVQTIQPIKRTFAKGWRFHLAELADRAAASSRRLTSPSLTLETLVVSGESRISMRLTGRAELLAAAVGLAVLPAQGQGSSWHSVPTVLCREDQHLWLSGTVPQGLFGGTGEPVLLGVTDGARCLGLVVPGRSRLRHRWSRHSFDRYQWPVRVRLRNRQRLTLTGCRPTASVPFDVGCPLDGGLTISWWDATTRASAVRLVQLGGDQVLIREGAVGDDGKHGVEIDRSILAQEAHDWRIEVLRTGRPPAPLQRPLGQFVALRGLARFPVVERSGDEAMTAHLRFGAGNSLILRVRRGHATSAVALHAS